MQESNAVWGVWEMAAGGNKIENEDFGEKKKKGKGKQKKINQNGVKSQLHLFGL